MLIPSFVCTGRKVFFKEDLKDMMAFRLSDEDRFNDFPAWEKADPETMLRLWLRHGEQVQDDMRAWRKPILKQA